jgi:hypothetical protein
LDTAAGTGGSRRIGCQSELVNSASGVMQTAGWLQQLMAALLTLCCGCLLIWPKSIVATSGFDWTLGGFEADLRDVSHQGMLLAARMKKIKPKIAIMFSGVQ